MPRYVTSASTSDIVDGWRSHRRDGGVVVDIASDRVLSEGLSMPHSPRVHDNAVWVLDSGNGHLLRIDPQSGAQERVAFCPGFLRGLSFHHAHGIIAQSLGGGGGIFQQNGATLASSLNRAGSKTQSGAVDIEVAGSVTTKADTAWAIFAQNQTGGLVITVEEGGTVTGSSAAPTDGIYNGGAVYAVTNTDNADQVALTIDGTLAGNVLLPSGASETGGAALAAGTVVAAPASAGSRVLTSATGTFVTGAIARADTVLNAGAIDLGGADNLTRTTIDGDLEGLTTARATAMGLGEAKRTVHYDGARQRVFEGGIVTDFDVDLKKGRGDYLKVAGDLSGRLGISLNALSLLPQSEIELLRVAGAYKAEVEVLSSSVFSFAYVTADRGRLSTTASAHFADAGKKLSQNDRAVAQGLQSAWDALDAGVAQLAAAENGPSLGEVFAAFHDVTPETFGSEGLTLSEEACVYGTAYGAYGVYDGVANESGFDARTWAMRVGGQGEIAEDWFIGGPIGYETSKFSGDERPESLDAQSIMAAIALTREIGAFKLSGAIGGGHTWGTSRRAIAGFGVTARADPQSSFLFGRLKGAYQLTAGDAAYIEPSLALDVFGLRQAGYRERGAGALNLVVGSDTQVLAGLTPAVEIGTRLDVLPDVAVRLFAKGGLTFLSDDEFTSHARFAGLSAMDAFETTTPIGDVLGSVSAGFAVTKGDTFELRLNYDGTFAQDVQSHGGTLRLGYRF